MPQTWDINAPSSFASDFCVMIEKRSGVAGVLCTLSIVIAGEGKPKGLPRATVTENAPHLPIFVHNVSVDELTNQNLAQPVSPFSSKLSSSFHGDVLLSSFGSPCLGHRRSHLGPSKPCPSNPACQRSHGSVISSHDCILHYYRRPRCR
jgi:hypothetical protein